MTSSEAYKKCRDALQRQHFALLEEISQLKEKLASLKELFKKEHKERRKSTGGKEDRKRLKSLASKIGSKSSQNEVRNTNERVEGNESKWSQWF